MPIRGGIPICFPQFANQGPLSKHGFARTIQWRLTGAHNDSAGVSFVLEDRDLPPTIAATWPYRFCARISVSLQHGALVIDFEVSNIGGQPFTWTGALHTYLRVRDVARVRIYGLAGCSFRDNADPNNAWFDVDGGFGICNEVERLFRIGKKIYLRDLTTSVGGLPSNGEFATPPYESSSVSVSLKGFSELMVWNPGSAGQFADLPSDAYREFICIEPAVVDQPVALGASQTWRGNVQFAISD